MQMTCPACNCLIEPTGLHVALNEDGDRAWRAGTHSPTIRLPGQQAEAAAVIASKGAEFATVDRIMIGFHGPKWLDADFQQAPRVVSSLRANLAKLGLVVIHSRHRGYSIRIRNGCDCLRPAADGQIPALNRQWTDANLRIIARAHLAGKSQGAIGQEFGVSRNAIASVIKRHHKRFLELKADEASRSMGDRQRDVLRVPVAPRLEHSGNRARRGNSPAGPGL